MRISWFDVVGKALAAEGLDRRAVARGIEELSATYREYRDDFAFRTAERRAAYLWHLLPAHVCDLTRLFLDLGVGQGRRELRVLALGAGPGTEALALLDAVTQARGRGLLEELERVEVVRVDRVADWDRSFAALLGPAREQARRRDPGLGEAWTLKAPARALRADLGRSPLPAAVAEAAGRADLVVAANLLSEVPPRGEAELPPGLRAALRELYGALGPAEVVLVDRAGAPGARARLEAAADLAREVDPGAVRSPVRDRQSRCGCALTRAAKALYGQVRLPTTRHSDRPVLNCKTAWCRIAPGPRPPIGSPA